MPVFKCKASEDWERYKSEIIRRFMENLIQFKGKMFLTGSVAAADDDEESDIDIAILTASWLDYGHLLKIVDGMKKGASFKDRLHILFLPEGMEKRLMERGARFICRQN